MKELDRQFDSALYERMALSRDQNKVKELYARHTTNGPESERSEALDYIRSLRRLLFAAFREISFGINQH